jgi:hypothetical protein
VGAKNNERSAINYFAMKAKTSDSDPTPFIGKSTKTGDKKWEITEKFNSIDGKLVAIRHLIYETEKTEGPKNKLELKLMDEDGTINMLSSNFNNLAYSLLNSLANCNPEKIDISVWLGKAREADGKRFPAVGFKNNGAEVKWKHDWANQPHPEKVPFKGKTIVDDTEVIAFWIKVIDTEIAPKLTAWEEPKSATTSTAPPTEALEAAIIPGALLPPDDDLPF